MSDKRVSEMTDDEIRTELLRLRPHSKAGETDDPPRAADLPDGTVVAAKREAWMKDPDDGWFSTHSFDAVSDSSSVIDDALAAGARVLRYGYDRRGEV